MPLIVHGQNRSPDSVFRLFGSDENSASFALGWVLAQSQSLLQAVTETIFQEDFDIADAIIALQKHGADGGFTDIELQVGSAFHAIIEAKRWWNVPTIEQFTRYHPRFLTGGAEQKRFVSVSAATSLYAKKNLAEHILGIQVVHLSWSDIRDLTNRVHGSVTSFGEKLWLRQLSQHLREFIALDRLYDNRVFVVSLGTQAMVDDETHTWIDVIEKDGCYFHPIGPGWPAQPPNYIGFRYFGKLQSVHHIDSFEIVRNLREFNPLWLATDSDHFVYRLGPPMKAHNEVRTGAIYRSGRVWCAIDTLLSGAYPTISDARDETQRRDAP